MSFLPVTMTRDDSIIALRNDYQELLSTFNPHVVQISRESAPLGAMCLLKVRVIAPTFMLQSENDATPKSVGELTFFVKVLEGYPQVKPLVYYPPQRMLASVNVFPNGHQCTDEWLINSSLRSLVEKTARDIAHDPCVTRFDSMANRKVEEWQREMFRRKAFPTIDLKDLFAVRSPAPMPPNASRGAAGGPVPLPGKR
ncbi:MAG: hypothetical protein ABFC31_09300 [Clostridiaceae bacterium]